MGPDDRYADSVYRDLFLALAQSQSVALRRAQLVIENRLTAAGTGYLEQGVVGRGLEVLMPRGLPNRSDRIYRNLRELLGF